MGDLLGGFGVSFFDKVLRKLQNEAGTSYLRALHVNYLVVEAFINT